MKALGLEAETVMEPITSQHGVTIELLYVRDSHERLHCVAYKPEDAPEILMTSKKPFVSKTNELDKLHSEDMTQVKQASKLLDHHCVSDVFWKEIARIFPVPRWRLIHNYRERLDGRLDILRTPGNDPGAYISFQDELRFTMQDICKREAISLEDLMTEDVKVKIEGDGCSVSRNVSWITILFVIIRQRREALQDPNLHRVLLVAQTQESYFNIRESCGPVFGEINGVATRGGLDVDGKFFPLKICLGADLKFLLLVLGLKSASSLHPCPFCLSAKARWADETLSAAYFNSLSLARTQQRLREHSDKVLYSVQYTPLLAIEPTDVFPDTLHMAMRIVDRLLDNVLAEFEDMDAQASATSTVATHSNVERFVRMVRDCGVPFDVHISGPCKGRAFTSLTGKDTKKVLSVLPEKMRDLLHSDTPTDALRLSKRLEDDTEERHRRPYHKSDEEYWYEGGIQESRKRRERISVIPSAQQPPNADQQQMTPGELRTELAARGVSTSSQDPKRLRLLLASSAPSEVTD
ncbi:hypothetical protein MTO96_033749 [Rhipicephalus appendiculatus]